MNMKANIGAPKGTAAFAVRLPVRAAGDDEPKGPGGGDGIGGDDDQVGIATKTRTRPKKPSMFKVLMLNDDYTPMEFVVMVLKRFFNMDLEQATRVMLHVHQKGVGVCGWCLVQDPQRGLGEVHRLSEVPIHAQGADDPPRLKRRVAAGVQ
jgi:ATP-dependent Clp protease adaptor protein ClpS